MSIPKSLNWIFSGNFLNHLNFGKNLHSDIWIEISITSITFLQDEEQSMDQAGFALCLEVIFQWWVRSWQA